MLRSYARLYGDRRMLRVMNAKDSQWSCLVGGELVLGTDRKHAVCLYQGELWCVDLDNLPKEVVLEELSNEGL